MNTGWRVDGFRGYADYMQTDQFAQESGWLMALADFDSAVVMCAEAVPWRCHRSLIADAVMARGGVVEDIFVEADGANSRRVRGDDGFCAGGGGQGLVSGGGGVVLSVLSTCSATNYQICQWLALR